MADSDTSRISTSSLPAEPALGGPDEPSTPNLLLDPTPPDAGTGDNAVDPAPPEPEIADPSAETDTATPPSAVNASATDLAAAAADSQPDELASISPTSEKGTTELTPPDDAIKKLEDSLEQQPPILAPTDDDPPSPEAGPTAADDTLEGEQLAVDPADALPLDADTEQQQQQPLDASSTDAVPDTLPSGEPTATATGSDASAAPLGSNADQVTDPTMDGADIAPPPATQLTELSAPAGMESELAAADDDEEDEAQDGDAQKAGEEATDEAGSFDREQAMSQILAALATREGLRTTNLALQHKLAEMFRKRRAEDKSAEIDKSGTDQDQRYGNIMTNLQQLHDEFNSMEKWNMQQETDYKTRLHDKREDLRKKSEEFRRYKRQTALTAENSRTGKPIPTKLVEQMEQLELKKEQDVAAVRLENIKLRNKLKRHEQTLRQKEELAEGLHLIDFEQLKIENQTYNEKIEERNEELMKLRKKITNVVQVLAHIKEKLQFVQQEHKALSSELSAVDAQVTVQRDSLPLAKQRRDTLRNRNVYIKEKNGLLGNDALLRDYELRVDSVAELRRELNMLEGAYKELSKRTTLRG